MNKKEEGNDTFFLIDYFIIAILISQIKFIKIKLNFLNIIFWSKCDDYSKLIKIKIYLYIKNLAMKRIFWSGRKFRQIDVHFVPSLCKLWHKACIANRTSFHSFSWCMDLTVHEVLEYCQETNKRKGSF